MVDYGTDLDCLDDIAENGGEVDGVMCLAQACVRRLITPRGGLIDDPNYGFDVRSIIDQASTKRGQAIIATGVDGEIEKDERVLSSSTAIAALPPRMPAISPSVAVRSSPTGAARRVTPVRRFRARPSCAAFVRFPPLDAQRCAPDIRCASPTLPRRSPPMRRTAVLVSLLALAFALPSAAQTKLLRFPDIHGDHVVFTYAGDLWTAPVAGGTAVRLTAHPGLEIFAKYSPDGQWIAFTGQYDGDEQVYVVPAGGGVPRHGVVPQIKTMHAERPQEDPEQSRDHF